MGSTSSTPAALMRVWSLSAYVFSQKCSDIAVRKVSRRWDSYSNIDTVIRKNEGGVTGCEFGVRHLDGLMI
jgi:hypothetical protein